MKRILIIIFLLFFSGLAEAAQVQTQNVQKGDILMFGAEACQDSQNCPDNVSIVQTYLAFLQQVGRTVGIYEPLFGDLKTLGQSRFLGSRYFWDHVEIVISDNPLVEMADFGREGVLVVLRPQQENPDFLLDIEEAVEKFTALQNSGNGYNQPLVGAVKEFIRWGQTDPQWKWFKQPALPAKWADAYGVNLGLEKEISAVQYSPYLNTSAHTDISDPGFWERDIGCSTQTFWALVWGWYKGAGGEDARLLFLDNIKNVNAVDALAPGQVGWWLLNTGLVEIVETIPVSR